MNNDISLEEFLSNQISALSRFREIVQAGWADNFDCPQDEWEKRMLSVRGTCFPGEKPIQPKQEWLEERKK